MKREHKPRVKKEKVPKVKKVRAPRAKRERAIDKVTCTQVNSFIDDEKDAIEKYAKLGKGFKSITNDERGHLKKWKNASKAKDCK
jgi:rubrerythrin